MLISTSIALSLRLAAAAIAFLSIIVLGRFLSPTDFGYYGTIMALLALLTPFVSMGWPITLLRFEANGVGCASLIRPAQVRVVCAAVCVFAFGGLISRDLTIGLGLALLPAYALLELGGAILRARGALVTALLPRDVLWRSLLLGSGLIAASFPEGQQAPLLFGVGLLGIVALLMWQRAVIGRTSPDGPLPKDARVVSLRVWACALGGQVFANLDTLVVGAMFGVETAGGYFAASRLASLAAFAHNAISLVVGPRLAKSLAHDDVIAIEKVLARARQISSVPALLAFAVFTAIDGQGLSVLGANVDQAKSILLVLAAGQVVNGLTGASGLFLTLSGQEGVVARTTLCAVVVASGAIPLGALLWGPFGAAMATCLVQSLSELWLMRRAAFALSNSKGALVCT